jgi:hypothetical protein
MYQIYFTGSSGSLNNLVYIYLGHHDLSVFKGMG